MTAFEFTGKGLALGAVVVVLASHESTARKLAREWAELNRLDPETLELKKSSPTDSARVVYGWNGDY